MVHYKPRTDVSDIFPDLHTKIVGPEIEIKIRLEELYFKKFIAWLDEHAQKEKEIHQKDVYYDKADPEDSFFFSRDYGYWNCTSYFDALRSVRIRHTNNKIIVNTKLRYVNDAGQIIRCDEYEEQKTQPEIDAFQQLLKQKGYAEKIISRKIEQFIMFIIVM